MTGTPDDLDEYSRIVNALAAAGSAAAQRALLDLLDDPDGNKSTYQRHITLNALGWTRHGAHSDTVDALGDGVRHVCGEIRCRTTRMGLANRSCIYCTRAAPDWARGRGRAGAH